MRYYRDKLGLLRSLEVLHAPAPLSGGEALLGEADDTQPGNPCGEQGIQTQRSFYDRLGWLAAQHTNDTDQSDSLRYDASGNMTWRKQGLSQPKAFTMAAGHNRLIKVVQPGEDSLAFTYDDDGNRAQEAKFDNPSGLAKRAFFYDGLGRTSGIGNYYFEPGYGTIWVGARTAVGTMPWGARSRPAPNGRRTSAWMASRSSGPRTGGSGRGRGWTIPSSRWRATTPTTRGRTHGSCTT